MAAYLLALDQGTTSSRAIVFDAKGQICGLAQKEFKQSFPAPGLVEHDAEEIWSSQYAVAFDALAKANLSSKDIAAIGITNQRETTVVWDRKTSQPICPAIVWQDRRTTSLCEQMRKQGREDAVRRKTGLVLDPYFSATKLRWILDHIPGARARAERGELAFGTVDSWLTWKLTGGKLHITDVSNASRTLLLNLETLDWDPELLELFAIPRSLLPEVRSSSELYGSTAPDIFPTPIRIGALIGDQQAALFGSCSFNTAQAKATYGTGCFLLMNTGERPTFSQHHLLTTVAWRIGHSTRYALEGSVFIAGAAIQWLRDQLGLIHQSAEIDALAESVLDSGGVTFVPAFTGLGAPHWDPHARGAMFGLTRGTTSAHLARATLEAIALSASDVLDAMEHDTGKRIAELRVDGGAVASDLLMQLQADLIQTSVFRPEIRELTALGAAMLAGLAAGVWKTQDELRTIWKLQRRFTPQQTPSDLAPLQRRWKRAIELVKAWHA